MLFLSQNLAINHEREGQCNIFVSRFGQLEIIHLHGLASFFQNTIAVTFWNDIFVRSNYGAG